MFSIHESGFRHAILKLLRRNKQEVLPQEELVARFEIRDRFLSDEELKLYRRLCEATSDRAIVCPKPRVLETLRVLNAPEHLEDALRIERKHIDFLICSESTGHPLCAVQLDWWNADQECYRPRQQLLHQAFERASFPVVYVPSDRLPTSEALRAEIAEFIGTETRRQKTRIDRPQDAIKRSEQVCASDVQSS